VDFSHLIPGYQFGFSTRPLPCPTGASRC
jgi:hypothetical protein